MLHWPVGPIYIPAVPQPFGSLREQFISFFPSPGNIWNCRCLFAIRAPWCVVGQAQPFRFALLHWLWHPWHWSFKPGILSIWMSFHIHQSGSQRHHFLPSDAKTPCFAPRVVSLMSVVREVLNVSGDWTACSAKSLQAASFFGIIYYNRYICCFFLGKAFLWFIILTLMFPSYSLTNRLPMWHNIRSFSEVQMVKLSHKRQRLAFVLEKKKKSCYLPEKYIYQARLTESICMKSAWFYPIFLDFCFGVASWAELLLRPTCGCPNLTLPPKF